MDEDSKASTSYADLIPTNVEVIWNYACEDYDFIKRLIQNLILTFPEISARIANDYLNSLSRHGVFVVLGKLSNRQTITTNLPLQDIRKDHSVHLMFNELSLVTKKHNEVNFFLTKLVKNPLANIVTQPWKLRHEWVALWKLFLRNNQYGLEKTISSSLLHQLTVETFVDRGVKFKNSCYRIYLYADVSLIFLVALQVAIQNQKTPLELLVKQIYQLTHNYFAKSCDLKYNKDIMGQMTEAILALFLFKNREFCDEIDGLTLGLQSEKKLNEFNAAYNAYKIVIKINTSTFDDLSMFSVEAERLSDLFEDYLFEVTATVFVETTCKVMKTTKLEEVIPYLSSVCKRHPSLAERLIDLAIEYGLGYAIDSIVDDACSEDRLEPTSPVWIKWCDVRLRNISRYGAILDTIRKCLRVLFRFLDYSANRDHIGAWIALHDALQKATVEMVKEEWEERKDWWYEFHLEAKKWEDPQPVLPKSLIIMKNEVFTALQSL